MHSVEHCGIVQNVEVNILTMKYITATLLALVVLPAVAFGGVVWSQNNVTNTYEQRIVEIDAQIEQLTTREVEIMLPFKNEYYFETQSTNYVDVLAIREEVAKLQEEKRILEVAYWLINNSFE